MTSGARPRTRPDEPFEVFADAVGPSIERAKLSGVRIAVEPTTCLHAELSFTHTLADATDLARVAGTAICLDLFHCWTDLHFAERVAAAAPYISHVQLSDYVQGDKALPARAVPGDGIVPLTRLLDDIRATGYNSSFDLELRGPRIDAEGHGRASARGLAWMTDALT